MPSLGWFGLRSCAMIPPLSAFSDIHSHDESRATDGKTVVSRRPGLPILPNGWYSVGIHPWDTSTTVTLKQLRALVNDSISDRVVAIGEAGLDRLRGGDIDVQLRLFRLHAKLARKLRKPLIIHCVRAYDLLLREARMMRPHPGEWIVHGFRGKPELARQLLDAGIDISLGLRHHHELPGDVVPPSRLYRETDEG